MAEMEEDEDGTSKDLFQIVVDIMSKTPDQFHGLNLFDLGPFISDQEYLINAIKMDICKTEEYRHVWAFESFKNALCSRCLEKLPAGLLCLKCLLTVHCYCYKPTVECTLEYYDGELPNFIPHIWSNKIIKGRCDTCKELLNKYNVGKICRWCGYKVDSSCEYLEEQCTSPRFKQYLYPPIPEEGKENVPVLIFINPDANKGYGDKLMRQFLRILHPMQVIDIRVTDPIVAFSRFSGMENFTIFICGGDRMCSYIMRAYTNVRPSLRGTPKFRFVPLDPQSEIGRSFGGRIKYSKKNAEYLLEQLPRLETYDVNRWEIQSYPKSRHVKKFKENFLFSFAFGLETYVETQIAKEKLWMRIVKTITPARIHPWFVRWEGIVQCGAGWEPKVNEFLTLEIDGQIVDLKTENYLAVILVSRISRGDERGQNEPYVTQDIVDVYGITEYFKLTKRNIEKKGIKLGEARNIKACVHKNCPYLADGYTQQITRMETERKMDMRLALRSSIQVVAVSETYLRQDKPLTRRGRREGEDEPLSLAELFLAPLEKIQREEELRIERRALAEEEEQRQVGPGAEEGEQRPVGPGAEEEEEPRGGQPAEEEEQVVPTSSVAQEEEAEREPAFENEQVVPTAPIAEEGEREARRDAAENEEGATDGETTEEDRQEEEEERREIFV